MTWGIIGSTAATMIGGQIFGGGGGGSSGGSTPPVYIPTNQKDLDQSFQDAYKQYQNAVGGYYGTTNPLNQQLLQSQFKNPYAPGVLQGATMAGQQYGNTAGQLTGASNSMFGNAADISQWMNLDRNGMISRAPEIGNAFSGMMGIADQSNATYQDLINQQRAQQGNVQDVASQLYGAGGKALSTADQLAAMQMGQGGNVQGSANDLYSAARAIGNTAFDPQSALYEQNKQQLVDSVRAGEYARGIQMSPYGASVEADTLGKFQNDWQNQQLARQAQGISSMAGASQSAQGLGANWANEIANLQSQGISNVAGAGQAAQGMTNSYINSLAGLTDAMGANYRNLTGGAANLLENWSQSQANVANTFGSALGQDYLAAAGLGDTAAQMYNASGQAPYLANQTIYGGQNQALQNFNANTNPYLTGLNQLQSNALGYMNFGQGAQSQAFGQNMQNANFANQMGQQMAPAISQGINSIWNGGAYGGQNTGVWGQNYVPTSSDVSALFGNAGYG